MTKKDYIMFAEVIKLATDSNGQDIKKEQLLSLLVCKLKEDNPRFDGVRFFDACCR